MNIHSDWPKIRKHFSQSFDSSLHVSIASVDSENSPTSTPIGSLFLNEDQSGFYFEMYPSKLPKHAEANNKICVLGVNSNKWFWIRSLFNNKFSLYPAVKLYGELGAKRQATDSEVNALRKRMRSTKMLKGHKYLWGSMQSVREIRFYTAEIIKLGNMTKDL